jgi:hypothetical protein
MSLFNVFYWIVSLSNEITTPLPLLSIDHGTPPAQNRMEAHGRFTGTSPSPAARFSIDTTDLQLPAEMLPPGGTHRPGCGEDYATGSKNRRFSGEVPAIAGEDRRFSREMPGIASEDRRFSKEMPAIASEDRRFSREMPAITSEDWRFSREMPGIHRFRRILIGFKINHGGII